VRPEIREADARWEVVRAAEAWRAVGAIDDDAFAAIAARYADDRRRTKSAFRALFFVFTLLGGLATGAFASMFFRVRLFDDREALAHAVLLAALATIAAFGAEAATAVQRLRRFGIEEGLVAVALLFTTAATFLLVDHAEVPSRPSTAIVALAFAVASALAVWRWGTPGCGALAAAGLFVALFVAPGARWLWLGAGVALALAADRVAGTPSIAIAYRRRAEEAAVVAVAAVYAAVHIEGIARDLFGWIDRVSQVTRTVEPPLRALSWTAMFALPLALVTLGVKRRDRLALSLGALFLLVSCGGAVDAVDLEPVWLVLLVAGLILLGAAAAPRGLFARSSARIAGGFTDRALFESTEGRGFLEIAASLAAFTPAARRPEAEEGFRGGGGELGGGGASGKF